MALNKHHHRALWIFGLTWALILFMGVLTGFAHHVSAWHGIYCTTGFATTAGCDLPMQTAPQFILGWLSMVLMVPLLTSVWAFVTTGLTADHIDSST